MTKFNQVKQTQKAKSYEGATQFQKNVTEDWLNFLFSSYLEPQFYENAEEQQSRFIDLTQQVIEQQGAEFVAKAALFSRDKLGLRSISQLTAALLNKESFPHKRNFYAKFPVRPDDMGEIFACLDSLGQKRSHALVRGFADYLPSISQYQLGKYKMSNHNYNIYDIINICHPKPSKAIQALKNDTLEKVDTWETRISATKGDQEKKETAWKELIENNKLGYMALLRNLRNILDSVTDDYWIMQYLIPAIQNEKSILYSRVYPYQIYTAYKMIEDYSIIRTALEFAFITACRNIEPLPGNTMIFLDVSGSMEQSISAKSKISLKEVGAVYAIMYAIAAARYKNCSVSFVKFGSTAKANIVLTHVFLHPFAAVESFANNNGLGYGTNVSAAFKLLHKPYDRILLISDQQNFDDSPYDFFFTDSNGTIEAYKKYCHQFGDTHLYSFDLGNYNVQVANPNNPYVHLATTLNDKVFEFMPYLEEMGSLVDYINNNVHYYKE